MSGLDEAIEMAVRLHAGQVDKAGEPYILHPLRVMLACKTELERIVAVLHDTVEDTGVEASFITYRFGGDVASAVDALTKRDGESYQDFIQRCALNPIARIVKLADLADNMNLDRLPGEPTMADAKRQMKYADARAYLWNQA